MANFKTYNDEQNTYNKDLPETTEDNAKFENISSNLQSKIDLELVKQIGKALWEVLPESYRVDKYKELIFNTQDPKVFIDGLKNFFNSLAIRITIVENNYINLSNRVQVLESTLATMNTTINNLTTRVSSLESYNISHP